MDFDATSDSPRSSSQLSAEPFASQRIMRLLATAQAWCYVLACVGFGYVALSALRLGITVAVIGAEAIVSPALMLIGLLMALVLYGVPSWMLFRYAQRIGRLRQSGDPGLLPGVFAAQRQFWIAIGLALAVVVAGVICVIGVDVSQMTM